MIIDRYDILEVVKYVIWGEDEGYTVFCPFCDKPLVLIKLTVQPAVSVLCGTEGCFRVRIKKLLIESGV